MGIFNRWGKALGRIVRAVDSLPAQRPAAASDGRPVVASRARAMLERIRRGEYEFSASEISEILKKNNWLGQHQDCFESLDVSGDSMVEVGMKVPLLGNLKMMLLIVDLWHDHRVSSIDFKIQTLAVEKFKNPYIRSVLEKTAIWFLYMMLRWNGSWRHESLRFVLRVERTIRLYVEWPEKKSPLLGNISVIGVRIQKKSLIFYTFRRSAEQQSDIGNSLRGGYEVTQPTASSRIAVLFSWVLLGAYAFVLVHVTLPVLGGAFQLMPQDATAWHIWVLTQVYNLCVILLSYFFLRITMLPLYLKWNKSKEDLATLISLEERDHQYLRPLTGLVKKMQLESQSKIGGGKKPVTNSVATGTIAQMLELMSTIRDQSRQRLLGMTRMRRGWVQDLLVGYIFIFSLEWMYYKGLLTPLSVSIKWVNRFMMTLLLPE